ncbi:MAG: COX15/CtaA family protein [Agromyces sp.]
MGSADSVHIRRRVFVTGWISFVVNVLIVGTGGAVRLTGSGLGCPTWPTCDGRSIVTTPEMGIHGLIEFGNRTLTGVLVIAALAVIWAVWNIRRERRDLWRMSLIVLAGIIAQAIVGGVTVWLGLNPIIVGFHYVASLVLVCVTAAFLVRARTPQGPRVLAVSSTYARLTHLTSAFVALTVTVGVLTTGAGPHSGDANAGRNGFDAELLQHVHAWPGYATLIGAVALCVGSFRYARHLRGWSSLLLSVVLVQVAVGLWQARTGLPVLLVGIHMVLAVLLAAAMTVVILKLKRPELV